MSENRKQVLEMLAAGKITAEEAEGLLAALESGRKPGDSGSAANNVEAKPKPKYLRVLVETIDSTKPSGEATVNVRIPMQLLRAGVKLAGLIPAHARAHIDGAMKEHGIPFDLSQIKPENLEELVDQLSDLTVDVDQKHDNVKVRVFCE